MEIIHTAKLFQNGHSQAVRLPKIFRFEGEEVLIYREGNRVILESKGSQWDDFFLNTERAPVDFLIERNDTLPQPRELF